MRAELASLVGAVVLTVLQLVVAGIGSYLQVGAKLLVGNREDMPYILGWAGRAVRAHRNMLESLPLFAILVLVCHAAGVSNPATVLGAQLFLWARVAYAVLYIAGVPWARTSAWLLATFGLVVIATQLV